MDAKFIRLEVWKQGMDLVSSSRPIYQLLIERKEFGLADQFIRSAISIPSNIAEGAESVTDSQFYRYLCIANGSLAEYRTQLEIAFNFGLVSKESFVNIDEAARRISKQLFGLKKYLKAQIAQSSP